MSRLLGVNVILIDYLVVFLGGALGAFFRGAIMFIAPTWTVFWIVNGIGSFLMGGLQAYFLKNKHQHQMKLFLTTGMLGSFTTFSAMSAEWLLLLKQSPMMAFLYAFGMTIICVALAASGYFVMKPRGGK
ncbi:fluoride efflux transporter FluC [Enterococcus sp.]|uniref:fluoride efflux transporter FluC n=1 Tax=Enterococcus sp. TaxID=35783 RepID=UPI002FC5D841